MALGAVKRPLRLVRGEVRRYRAQWRNGVDSLHQWAREPMNRDIAAMFDRWPLDQLDAVEVSGTLRGGLPWKSYRALEHPEFDLCVDDPPGQWDVVICEQVLEHVRDPCRAVRILRDMTRPGGRILVSTPFLIRLHGHPDDYWRFAPAGMQVLLESAGLTVESLESWGNPAVVRSNLRRWSGYFPGRSLKQNYATPTVVWAVARR